MIDPKFGFEISEKEWDLIKNKENYCEQCYDGSSFPAYKCRRCLFFNQKKPEYVFCIECELCKSDDGAIFGLRCLLTGNRPASGFGCSKGKKRRSNEKTKNQRIVQRHSS